MVEFYYSKKRRGIAGISGRTTRVVEPKPYWPGLEIDEHDRKESRQGSNNIDTNGKTNPIKPSVESNKKTDNQNNDDSDISAGRVEGSSNITDKEKRETKPSPTNDSRRGKATRVSAFRSRKRKRKLKPSVNDDGESDNVFQQIPGDSNVTGEEQEGGRNSGNTLIDTATSLVDGSANEVTGKFAQPIDTKANDSTTKSTMPSREFCTSTLTAIRATVGTKDTIRISAKKTRYDNDTIDDLSSASSGDEISTRSTPRSLVKFLLQKKFPVLNEVVSDIRDILYGMVSRSPALLQQQLGKAVTPSSASSGVINEEKIKRNIGISSDGDTNLNIMLTPERKQPPQEEAISKLEDICKRHEMLLDRMAAMDSSAARREENFLQHTKDQQQARQQQQEQKEQRENSTAELQRDYQTLKEANANLKMKVERSSNSIALHCLELKKRDQAIKELLGKQTIQHEQHERKEQSERQQEEKSTARLRRDYRILQEYNTSLKAKVERSNHSIKTYRLEMLERDRAIKELEAQKLQLEQKEQRYLEKEESLTNKLRKACQAFQEVNAKLIMNVENNSIETYQIELLKREQAIEELKESKRVIHGMFQSRFDELFRELSGRENIIEKQRKLLQIARIENERLRNRIGVREEGMIQSAETEAGPSHMGVDTSYANENASAAVLGRETASGRSGDNHYAYSHRVRHRQTNGHQQQYRCSLQSTVESSSGTTGSAYSPRIRRFQEQGGSHER